MATFDTYEMVPNPGAAWQRACDLWYERLPDPLKTLTAPIWTNGTSNTKCVRMQYVTAADTFNTYICVASIPDTAVAVPLDYFLASPGWNTPVRVVDQAYTAKDIRAEFRDNLLPVRTKAFVTIGAHAALFPVENIYTGIITGYDAWQYVTTIRKGGFTAVDAAQVTRKNTVATIVDPLNVQMTNGKSEGQIGVMVSGGVNLAPLVQAAQDLLNRDVQTTVDNGAVTVLQYSGDFIT